MVQSSSLSLSPGGFAIFNYGSTKLSAKLRQQLILLKLTKMQLLLKGDAPYHQLTVVVPYRSVQPVYSRSLLAGPCEMILVHNSLNPVMQLRSIEEKGESRVLLVFVCISNFYILMGKDETDSPFFMWKTCVSKDGNFACRSVCAVL